MSSLFPDSYKCPQSQCIFALPQIFNWASSTSNFQQPDTYSRTVQIIIHVYTKSINEWQKIDMHVRYAYAYACSYEQFRHSAANIQKDSWAATSADGTVVDRCAYTKCQKKQINTQTLPAITIANSQKNMLSSEAALWQNDIESCDWFCAHMW